MSTREPLKQKQLLLDGINYIAIKEINILEMWANAQSDGRPAKHRWHPLFNAAKFS